KNSVHGRRMIGSDHGGALTLGFSDERWSKIVGELPHLAVDPQKLRREISWCCNDFLLGVRAAQRGSRAVAAVTRGGGKQPAPLERLIGQLKSAKATWAEINDMHDDHLGVLSDLTRDHSLRPHCVVHAHTCTRVGEDWKDLVLPSRVLISEIE